MGLQRRLRLEARTVSVARRAIKLIVSSSIAMFRPHVPMTSSDDALLTLGAVDRQFYSCQQNKFSGNAEATQAL